MSNKKCYECGKEIEKGKEFTFDNLNYLHWDCCTKSTKSNSVAVGKPGIGKTFTASKQY